MSREKLHRRSIRLNGYDYTQPGGYFVTIRTQDGECLFGDVADGKMVMNAFGKIVDHQWRQIPRFFPNCGLDEFMVMPDHFHGIVVIRADRHESGVGAKHSGLDSKDNCTILPGNASPLQYGIMAYERPHGTVPDSLPAIIQNFMSVTTRKINHIRKTPGQKLWQRNYYEHIIRNDELLRIREYIRLNPLKWNGSDNGKWL
jgi:REP element-mobilizing transposase RayT